MATASPGPIPSWLLEGSGQSTDPVVDLAVVGPDQTAIGFDRDDLLIGKLADGAVVQGRQQQREIHHVGHLVDL